MQSHLKWPDYLILAAFLVISLAIGLYHSLTGGRQKTTAEFIMADRRLRVLPTAISLLVSFQSSILFLGLTAEMYCYGAQFLLMASLSMSLAVFLTERIIIPWLFPLKLVSIYHYLELRFSSRSVRVFGATLGILTGVLFMGVSMYAPSAALESVTGLPLAVSVPVMAAVAVAYTALGGMRAVIWTDVFQFVTVVGGIIAIFVKGLIVVGGFSNIFEIARGEGRLILANFSFDPRERITVWGMIVGYVVGYLNAYGMSQAAVQRFSAVKDLSKARLTVLINIPPMVVMNILICFMGLIVLAYFASINCDPIVNGEIRSPNQLLPIFVMKIFADSPGFAGLFLATLYGGSLSCVSSSLSGSAANCWEDMLQWKLNHLTESRKAIINRILVVIFGAFSAGVAFLAAAVPGPITQVTSALCSSVAGPLTALFLLGGISRHANWKGVLIGGILGLALNLWLCVGSLTVIHEPLPFLSVEGCDRTAEQNYTWADIGDNYTSSPVPSYSVFEDNATRIQAEAHTFRYFIGYQPIVRHGMENFYSISFLWFTAFGLLATLLIGVVASLIFRDRNLEKGVEDRLLLRFSSCCRRKSTEMNNNEEKSDTDDETATLKGKEDSEALPQPEKITAL